MKPRQSLVAFLLDIGTDTIGHSGGALLLHLFGTESILESWGAPSTLSVAGLFHSVYGTHSFQTPPLSATPPHRLLVQDLIGKESEEIVYYYSILNYHSITSALKTPTPAALTPTDCRAMDRTGSLIAVRLDLLSSILNLIVANEAEQYARASYPVSDFLLSLEAPHLYSLFPEARSFITRVQKRAYACR
jgi:hypothetical protein